MQVFFMKDGILFKKIGHTDLSNGYCEMRLP